MLCKIVIASSKKTLQGLPAVRLEMSQIKHARLPKQNRVLLFNDESAAKHGRRRFLGEFTLIVDKDEWLIVFIIFNLSEKAHQVWNAQSFKHSFVIDGPADSLRLFLLHLLQPLIHSVLDHEALDEGLRLLANAKDAAESFPITLDWRLMDFGEVR